jgi:acyl-CoA reductase-like NAD-dependent aldehyde dehydrogenase
MTGTGIVPPDDVTLPPGDEVVISDPTRAANYATRSRRARGMIVSVNPARPDDVIARAPETTRADLDNAIAAAERAQADWAARPAAQRADALEDAANDVAVRSADLAQLV